MACDLAIDCRRCGRAPSVEPIAAFILHVHAHMPNKLFVGNLPFRLSESELREAFADAGDVKSVFIPKDRETKLPRGFAFVEMADDDQAREASN